MKKFEHENASKVCCVTDNVNCDFQNKFFEDKIDEYVRIIYIFLTRILPDS